MCRFKMAKVIHKRSKSENVLELISLKEMCQIYLKSFVIVFYVLLKNVFSAVKSYCDKRLRATRRVVQRKFHVLSSSASRRERSAALEGKSENDKEIIIAPCTLTSQFGDHKCIEIKSTRFHYVEKGSKENARVALLIHGFPDCFFGWRNQIDILALTHRVIALDLKGFNDSDKPQMRHHYRPSRICDELKLFVDALNIKSVAIIAHDIGAVIGWIFALQHPETVTKFVSISTPHPNLYFCKQTNESTYLSSYWLNMVQLPLLPEREMSKNYSFVRQSHSFLMNSSGESREGKFSSKNVLQTYEYIFSRSTDWTGALNYFRNFYFYRVKPSFKMRCPCMLIFGTENSTFKLDSAIKSAEFCENPKIKVIDGAASNAHQTHPEELNEILLKFLLGEKRADEESDDEKSSGPLRRGLVGRMMNKVYSVSQQYGTITASGGRIFGA